MELTEMEIHKGLAKHGFRASTATDFRKDSVGAGLFFSKVDVGACLHNINDFLPYAMIGRPNKKYYLVQSADNFKIKAWGF